MADDMSVNHTSNSTFDIYLRKLVIYVAKNPVEFVTYGKSNENIVFSLFRVFATSPSYNSKYKNEKFKIYIFFCMPI